MARIRTKLLSLACVAAVVGLSGWLAPSKSYISVANNELTRLLEPISRADALIMDLGLCLGSLIDRVPLGQRVAIITPNNRIDHELHVALGAMGRVPSLVATSDWVLQEVDGNNFSAFHQGRAAPGTTQCQGYSFVAEERSG